MIDTKMQKRSQESEDAKLLMTIPGIGVIRAMIIVAEIDDIRRFPSEKQFGSYAGLTPTIRQSGSMLHVGRVSLQASMHLKNALAQAALTAAHMKRENVLQNYYNKLAPIKGKKSVSCNCTENEQHCICNAAKQTSFQLFILIQIKG